MTFSHPNAAKEYHIPPMQLDLFGGVERTRLLEDGLKTKAERLERERRFSVLFGALEGKSALKDKVVAVLDRVKGDDDAFTATLDTLAYARRCDPDQQQLPAFTGAVEKLEKCVEHGIMPVDRMRSLLNAGISFNQELFMFVGGRYYFDEAGIQAEKNWLAGWDKGPEKRMQIDFPPKENLERLLRDMGQSEVSIWKTGATVPVEEAEERVLRAVYVDRLRAKRSAERRAERFITTNDW
jgi:hypothetical protein